MATFITGDLHGARYFDKLREFTHRFGHTLSQSGPFEDYLIILGDFGLIWDETESPAEAKLLDELEHMPFTTLFIDGNHENFDRLEAMPTETWMGGHVHRIRPHIMHLMRGEVFDIDGKTFFTMGGASSIHSEELKRVHGWWPQEIPSQTEREHALDTLDAHDWSVDYVLTHCPPAKTLKEYSQIHNSPFTPCEYDRWLQSLEERLNYEHWFFGHMHDDRPWEPRMTALFYVIYDLDSLFKGDLWGPETILDDWELYEI